MSVARFLTLAIVLLWVGQGHAQVAVPEAYQDYIIYQNDDRSLWEKALNRFRISTSEIGPLFVLIAGVDTYPNLPADKRFLKPAKVDLDRLIKHFKADPGVMEIVELRNSAVNLDSFDFFLDRYFPARLREVPRSRFIFAYSGHGVEEDDQGYLLKPDARSLLSSADRINLHHVRVSYRRILRTAYQSLILLNSCHSGAFHTRDAFGKNQPRLIVRQPGHHVITAGGNQFELVYRFKDVGEGSVFFEKFFAALEGRADRLRYDGLTTVEELYAYLKSEIQLATNEVQTPRVSDLSINGSTGGMFFLNQLYQGPYPADQVDSIDPDYVTAFGGGSQCNSANDCLNLAENLAKNTPIPLTALAAYEEACDKGAARGCARLAEFYTSGQVVAKNEIVAKRFLERACEFGHDESCQPSYESLQSFKDCELCPEMVVIPAGRFLMGSPKDEPDRNSDEGPQHEVSIQSFAVAKTEVTVGDFQRFVAVTDYRTDAEKSEGCRIWDETEFKSDGERLWNSPGFTQDNNHPVTCVSWNDANAYLAWLNRETGRDYRLLSEAEFEYIFRAGSKKLYPWLDEEKRACQFANVADKSFRLDVAIFAWFIFSCDDGVIYTAPVASREPNAFGLHDTAGNVWEWAQDCWHGNYEGVPDDGSAWLDGPGADCSRRVLRGGGWSSGPWDLHLFSRPRVSTDVASNVMGFRLARTL
ncbi:MAG: hypothetical protein Tsb002_02660 [Wenzhouxiangellaceae bacterium]